jgi:lipopolysaccharide transport system permease protein
LNNRIVLEPGAKSKNYWKDIWAYRGLFYFLAWRDVLVRYKQTAIGIAWSLIRPVITIAMMCFVSWIFKAQVPNGVPRVVFVCTATLPWLFFAGAFADVCNSLVSNSNLITKVHFPRLIIPASTIIVSLIDFAISLSILIVLMLVFRYTPDVRILLLPVFMLLALLTAMGAGLIIATLNVKYRDFKYIVPLIIQFGVYISPVAFSSDYVYQRLPISILGSALLPKLLKIMYSLNPMVAVIDGFRWCIFGKNTGIYFPGFLLSITVSILFMILGIWYFRKTEKSFADVI